ncbi:hypothetical protein ES705_49747 [subsurface metagenome]
MLVLWYIQDERSLSCPLQDYFRLLRLYCLYIDLQLKLHLLHSRHIAYFLQKAYSEVHQLQNMLSRFHLHIPQHPR